MTGGGTGTVNTTCGIASFGFVVQRKVGGGPVSGSLTYTSPGAGIKLKATSFTSLVVTGTSADFGGNCKNNNVSCTFQVHTEDNGQGRVDRRIHHLDQRRRASGRHPPERQHPDPLTRHAENSAAAAQMDRIAIIGAGPCGLACAREFDRLGFDDWVVFERESTPGGLASSVVDPQGYTWDLGGHVVFSHFGEFDALLEEVLGDDVYEHERSSYIRFDDRWVPYPFQNNLRHLQPELVVECLVGLIEAPGGDPTMDFATWMDATFGPGITRLFMRPYNAKVWTTSAEEMASAWIGERVSVVDYRRALENVLLQRDDVGWGPNNTFRFPRTGGTGEIYRRLAERLGPRVQTDRDVVEIDADRRVLRFADGGAEEYDALVATHAARPARRLSERDSERTRSCCQRS